jgi:ABC-type antimicrobial peptide transport system permease subunit
MAIIVSESVAKRFWPGASPIGARVRLDKSEPYEVVGVVADARRDVRAPITPTVYVSERRWPSSGGDFIVRTKGDAMALVPGITQVLHALDPQVPLINPRTLRDVLMQSIARQRLAMALMGAFAVLALLLAALGVYSVMAYSVIGRMREFGIRSALGAERSSIVALVLRQGAVTTAVGVVAGVVMAAIAARYTASLLVGVSSHDVGTFVTSAGVLVVVAALACLIPARAATRVQPVEALRAE